MYREIVETIEHSLDKLYLFQMKDIEDMILTNEEIEQAKIIIKDFRDSIKSVKDTATSLHQTASTAKIKTFKNSRH